MHVRLTVTETEPLGAVVQGRQPWDEVQWRGCRAAGVWGKEIAASWDLNLCCKVRRHSSFGKFAVLFGSDISCEYLA